MNDIYYHTQVIYGHIECQSRMLPDGRGQHRKITKDEDGNVTEDTGWSDSGIEVVFDFLVP